MRFLLLEIFSSILLSFSLLGIIANPGLCSPTPDLDTQTKSLESRASKDYRRELADRKLIGIHNYATTETQIRQMTSNPERDYDADEYVLRDQVEDDFITMKIVLVETSFIVTARVAKSSGIISLEASWSQFRQQVSSSENSFIRICAGAILFACHNAELEYNSVKALKVKIQDSFETSVATKIKKFGKINRRICRDGRKRDEFYAMLAGRQAEIVNKFRPMGQRFLQGDAKLNCITAWYSGSGDPFWMFNFEGDSQSAPPYEECLQLPPQYGM